MKTVQDVDDSRGRTAPDFTVMEFPWPQSPSNERDLGQMSGSEACAIAMDYVGLTLAERMVAITVADSGGGWSHERAEKYAARLEVDTDELYEHLWSLLVKGFLPLVARRS